MGVLVSDMWVVEIIIQLVCWVGIGARALNVLMIAQVKVQIMIRVDVWGASSGIGILNYL